MTDVASDRDVAVTIETTRGEVQLRWNPTVGGFEVGVKDNDRMSWAGPFPFVETLEAATALTLPKRAHDLLERDREQEPGRVAARLVARGAVDVGTPTGLMVYRDGRVERYRVESLGFYVGGFDERGIARISFDDGKRSVPVTHVVVHSVDGFAWGYDGAGPRDAGYAMLRHELSRIKPGAINLDDVTTANSRLFTTDVVRVLVPNEPFRLSADTVRTWALEHELVSQLRSPEQETAKLLRSKVAEAARTALDASQSTAPLAQTVEPAPRTRRTPQTIEAAVTVILPVTKNAPINQGTGNNGPDLSDVGFVVLDGPVLDGQDDAAQFVKASPMMNQHVSAVSLPSQRVGVDATPLRDQLLMIGIQERSSPEVLAKGLNLEPVFVERVLSREQMLLDVGEVRAVCEGLHCDPDDLWPPVVVEEQILPQYPVQDWPPYKDRIEPPLGVKLAVSSVAWTAGIAMVQRVSGESLAAVIPLVQLGTNQPQMVPLITDTVNVVEKEVTIDLRNERDATVNVDSQRGEQRGDEKAVPNGEANRLLDGVMQSREVGR